MNLFMTPEPSTPADTKPVKSGDQSDADVKAYEASLSSDTLPFASFVDVQKDVVQLPVEASFGLPVPDISDADLSITGEEAVDLPEGIAAAMGEAKVSGMGAKAVVPVATSGQDMPERIPMQDAAKLNAEKYASPLQTRVAGTNGILNVPAESSAKIQEIPKNSSAQSLIEGRIGAQQIMGAAKSALAGGKADIVSRDAMMASAGTSVTATITSTLAPQSTAMATALFKPGQAIFQEKQLDDRVPPAAARLDGIAGAPASAPAAFGDENASVIRQPTQSILHANAQLTESSATPVEQEVAPLVATSERMAANPTSLTSQVLSGSETARQVAHQIATSAANGNNKTTEIALNPEELGRVRLSLSAGDGAVTVVILAERPETQELMRRHIDILAQEFRDLGYESINFSFDEDGQSDSTTESENTEPTHETMTDQTGKEGSATVAIPAAGLDLRL